MARKYASKEQNALALEHRNAMLVEDYLAGAQIFPLAEKYRLETNAVHKVLLAHFTEALKPYGTVCRRGLTIPQLRRELDHYQKRGAS